MVAGPLVRLLPLWQVPILKSAYDGGRLPTEVRAFQKVSNSYHLAAPTLHPNLHRMLLASSSTVDLSQTRL